MQTKKCPTCGEAKELDNFYNRSGKNSHLKRSWCIKCESIRQNGRDKNLIRFNERKRKKIRIEEWVGWLSEVFGDSPLCQCCGRPLIWTATDRRKGFESAILDHRHGGEEGIKSVYPWFCCRVLNDKNKAAFLSCDFGILCKRCNTSLPTQNRKSWLDHATRYVNGDS